MHKITFLYLFCTLPLRVPIFCEDIQLLHRELQKTLQDLVYRSHYILTLAVGDTTQCSVFHREA